MVYITAQLNHRIQPIDRGEQYEDPLDEMLQAEGLGSVKGGGTAMQESMEIDYVDIEIELSGSPDDAVGRIIAFMEEAGAPKGSKIIIEADGRKIDFGKLEGLGLYLNGTDLPDKVYEEEDINDVVEELDALLDDVSSFDSFWEGNTETALYAYGASFAEMKSLIEPYLAKHPLCHLSRIEQIA
jgi:hypothetical protein